MRCLRRRGVVHYEVLEEEGVVHFEVLGEEGVMVQGIVVVMVFYCHMLRDRIRIKLQYDP